MMTVMALSVFGAIVVTAQAENQPPDPRTVSHPVKKRTVSQTARPSQAKRNSYDVCLKKAHDMGLVYGQAGVTDYVHECMGLGVILSHN
jgi:hypothetical protein